MTFGTLPQPDLNPWISIWTKPRATIQQIVENDPKQMVLFLSMVGGVADALDRMSSSGAGKKLELPGIIAMAFIFGAAGGLVMLYIGAALVRWTGGWIGGCASGENIRAALAWSRVPEILIIGLWIPQIVLLGEEAFMRKPHIIDSAPTLQSLFQGLFAVQFILVIWAAVIGIKCLGQVQGFSAWKALGNLLLAGLVMIVPILAIVVGVMLIGRIAT